jgi:hypothetical protein
MLKGSNIAKEMLEMSYRQQNKGKMFKNHAFCSD